MQRCEKYAPKPISEFLVPSEELSRDRDAMDFEVGASTQGADLFHKERYLSMRLHREDGEYYVRGFCNQGEENFIVNYSNRYEEAIFSIQLTTLKNLTLEQRNIAKDHLSSML